MSASFLGNILGVRPPALNVVVVIYREIHYFYHLPAKEGALGRFSFVVIQHFSSSLVLNLQISLLYLISDKEITIVYMLALLALQTSTAFD